MAKGLMRAGVVGGSTLLGKELAEELAAGAFDVALLDEDEAKGQITSVGDEAAVVQQIGPGSFDGMGVCFFAGTAETTRRHWEAAVRAGAAVVDLTDALGDRAPVVSPWVRGETAGLTGRAVRPAHVVAVMLGLAAVRCAGLGLHGLAATVLEPASERGAAGLDEMHQQTVSLLSFQPVPKAEFDAQVAFNLVPELGAEARVSVASLVERILGDYRVIGGGLPVPLLQMVHAPVFHGYGVSMLLDFGRAVTAEEVEAALECEQVEIVGATEEAPSTVGAAGQGRMQVRVGAVAGERVWVWIAADNLKFAALHAMACAGEVAGAGFGGWVQ